MGLHHTPKNRIKENKMTDNSEEQKDDLHDQLVLAYIDYFARYASWRQRKSVRRYYRLQKSLRRIKLLTDDRARNLRDVFLRGADEK